MQGFDVPHQIWRLRHAKRISDGEAELIMRNIAENVQTYEGVTEVMDAPLLSSRCWASR